MTVVNWTQGHKSDPGWSDGSGGSGVRVRLDDSGWSDGSGARLDDSGWSDGSGARLDDSGWSDGSGARLDDSLDGLMVLVPGWMTLVSLMVG